MEGQLSADNLKAHDAHLKGSVGIQPERGADSSTKSSLTHKMGLPSNKLSLKDRLTLGGHSLTEDKKSDAGSGSRLSTSMNKTRFSRLRTKLKIQGLLGGTLSKAGSESGHKPIKSLENTYKVEPEDGKQFSISKAEQIMTNVFDAYLKGRQYDAKRFRLLSKSLADMIKERMKLSGIARYKIVATVLIVEDCGQSVRLGSRSLWDTEHDNHATVVFKGDGFEAVGSIFATFFA
ncbi:tctex1 domain-containing protein 1-like [Mizuhopecten yessoensis]|uniref:Tctex1 domain-containing protein 1 n=1 Tax=Mizuhopecten yessoensis TaxID=6573 RepID=A0A210QCJ2_MIZYE|nr:tctex1 domain-containing protein 1-like [Mizuhopecten yessoensis]OWF46431.1 Tctex1 domain-containing protein 1 [Mizuhopecten yessoensis]